MSAEFNRFDSTVESAVKNRVIPGLVIAAGQSGEARLLRAFGDRQVDPAPAPATANTVYDLASLTKAVVTSLLAMKAVESGVIHLDESLRKHLPLAPHDPDVTLRHVLAHAGGFPAHRKFYAGMASAASPDLSGKKAIVEKAAAEPLVYQPGSRSMYSDLGFILLGALLEKWFSDRLDRLAERFIFAPLGLASLGFVDLLAQPASSVFRGHDVAPTERCPVRGRMILGEVHDLNAYAMGGIAGHAGLFGCAEDLLRLGFALCAAHNGGSGAPIDRDVVRLFWRPAGIPGSTWRLGWDGPAATGSLAGDVISRRAVGHLSFTGCSMWIDPEQETCVVMLSNRVHPEVRDDPRFRALRPAVNDAALRAIGYQAR